MDPTEPIAPTEPTDHRRDMLAEQLEALEKATPEPETPAAPAPAAPTTDDGKPVRAADGKFAKAVAAAVVQPAAPEEPVWKRAPASWKKDHHDVWQSADPRLQEYAWQREEQMKAGVAPLIEKARFADAMNEVVKPYMNTIQGLGLDAPQAVKALMEADHALRTGSPEQKNQFFARLAQQYGVNLGNVAPPQSVDPTIFALQNELNNIRGEVTGWKSQQQKAEDQKYADEITKFSSKAEHFEEARPVMVQLLQSGMAATLEEAYDKAIRLNDELFNSVQSGRQAELDAEKRKAADRVAKNARAAAVSVRSAAPSGPPSQKAPDRRALLAEQFDQVAERL